MPTSSRRRRPEPLIRTFVFSGDALRKPLETRGASCVRFIINLLHHGYGFPGKIKTISRINLSIAPALRFLFPRRFCYSHCTLFCTLYYIVLCVYKHFVHYLRLRSGFISPVRFNCDRLGPAHSAQWKIIFHPISLRLVDARNLFLAGNVHKVPREYTPCSSHLAVISSFREMEIVFYY